MALPDPPRPWHALDVDAALGALGTHRDGLAPDEASARLARHGPNRLDPPPAQGPLRRFLLQFHNVLVYVLLASGAVVLLLGHALDALVIVGVTGINAVIGFVQEGRAEQALAAIRDMLAPSAAVLRGGGRATVPAQTLVPGDVVLLEAGDRVPADLRLIEAQGLAVDEAALTGESMPVAKSVTAVTEQAPLAERACMAYSGTMVTRGRARAVVTATGPASEIGRLTGLMAQVEPLATPLTRKLAAFGRRLTVAILAASGVLFLAGLWHGRAAAETFLAVVGLAVAAIPEGLPAIVTIALAIGVRRMAARHAIVRRLPSVETLGSVTTICTDKTGTLTRNEMSVARVATPAGSHDVSGAGYAPVGTLVPRDGGAPPLALAEAAALCNDAQLVAQDGEWRVEGDPTEGALLAFAGRAGVDATALRAARPRVDTIPFESDRRYMATLHRLPDGRVQVIVKGAPEVVLAMCGADDWHPPVQALAAEGMRVLALGSRTVDAADADPARATEGLALLGCVGLVDPPREEAIAAVARCRSAGIRVKMITGDHAITAQAIARTIGLRADAVVTGPELDGLDAPALARTVRDVDVFARASPEHKLAIVEALQADRQVAAMTGDGVNDAPALRRADVGVAMGRKGTEAAKEAAAIVLADDNFASIAQAVEEGRTVYENIRKAILYILPTNGAEAAAMVAALLFGLAIPITPVQILWVNMVTEVTLSIVIAFDPPEAGLMRRPPRAPDEPLLSRFLVWRLVLVTAVLGVAVVGLFHWGNAHLGDAALGRTLAVNGLVMGEILYLLNMRSVDGTALRRGTLTGNPLLLPAVGLLLVLQAAFTHWGPMQRLFGTTGLDATGWSLCVAAGLLVFVVVEGEKGWRRRRVGVPADPA